jgi:uncharacterized protein YndB with AHSA1/START domain
VGDPPDTGPRRVGISVNRTFDAPPSDVWREWTEPARFADWFGGPHGVVPLETVSMDVRPGGAWRLTMYAGPRRRRIEWHGEYLVVEAPERLEFTISDRPTNRDESDVIAVVLDDLGDGRTEMHFEQRGRMSAWQYRRAETGWSGFFDRMAERLTGR